jgi:ATP/ADP translocase
LAQSLKAQSRMLGCFAASLYTRLLCCCPLPPAALQYLGWSGAALISPLSMLLPGVAFFSCSLMAQSAAAAAAGTTAATAAGGSSSSSWFQAAATGFAAHVTDQFKPLGLVLPASSGPWTLPGLLQLDSEGLVVMGLGAGFVTALAACACHNSLFTPCKQMVYKTLPQQQQAESKAAVDLVGGQVGAAAWLWCSLYISHMHVMPQCD